MSMKILNGQELAGYIKERQARQVRALRQAHHILPKLAIIRTLDDPRIAAYVKLKKAYGADILIDVDEHVVSQAEAPELIKQLNGDPTVTGIIVQLPVSDPSHVVDLLNVVAPTKDVDGLGEHAQHEPATAMAILWLVNGYNIQLTGKCIVVVGQGRLVGAPMTKMLRASGYQVIAADKTTHDLATTLLRADVIISGTGSPGLITSDMVKIGAVVVDAGVATDKGKLTGDIHPSLRTRHDLTLTPEKGGVGPLTVCALFDNVIRAAQLQIHKT